MLFSTNEFGWWSGLDRELSPFDVFVKSWPLKSQLGLNLSTLNLIYSTGDALLPDIGLPCVLSRHYNSTDKDDPWRIGTPARFTREGDNFRWHKSDGATCLFTLHADGSYSYADEAGILYRLDIVDDHYVLRNSANPNLETYDAELRLVKQHLPSGQGVIYGYEADRLMSIASASGHQLLLEYEAGRVARIKRKLAGTQVKHVICSYEYQNNMLHKVNYFDDDMIRYSVTHHYRDGKLSELLTSDGLRQQFLWSEGELSYTLGENETYRFKQADDQCVLTYPDGNVAQFTLDEQGFLKRAEAPDFTAVNVDYNQHHQIEVVRQGIKSRTLARNAQGLLVGETLRNHAALFHESEYRHSAETLQIEVRRIHFDEAKQSTTNQAFVRDELGRVIYLVREVAGKSVFSKFTYDDTTGLRATQQEYAAGLVDAGFTEKSEADLKAELDALVAKNKAVTATEYVYRLSQGKIIQEARQHTAYGLDDDSIVVTTKTLDIDVQENFLQEGAHKASKRHYDGVGRVDEMEDVLGQKTERKFVDEKAEVEIFRPNGLLIRQRKNHTGRTFEIRDSDAKETREFNETLQYFDANGFVSAIRHNGRTRYQVHSTQGLLLFEVTEQGRVTGFTYDDLGNELSQIVYAKPLENLPLFKAHLENDLSLAIHEVEVEPADDDRINLSIYAQNQLRYQLAANGTLTVFDYDAAGHLRKESVYHELFNQAQMLQLRALDPQARFSQIIIPSEISPSLTEVNFAHADGLTALSIDAEGYATRQYFDGQGNVIRRLRANVVLPLSAEMSLADALQKFDAHIAGLDAKNIHDEHWRFDGLNRQIQHVDAEGYLTSTRYDDPNNKVYTIRHTNKPQLNVTDIARFEVEIHDRDETTIELKDDAERVVRREHANGLVETFVYDAANKLIQHLSFDCEDEASDTFLQTVRGTVYTYREDGKLLAKMSGPGVNALLQAKNDADKEAAWQRYGTHYCYNDKGDEIIITAPKAAVTRKFYDSEGHLKAVIDAEQYLTLYTHNEFDEVATKRLLTRPVSLSDLATLAGFSTGEWTQQLAEAVPHFCDKSDDISSFLYDSLGRVTHELKPDGVLFKTIYNGQSNQVLQVSHHKTAEAGFELLTLPDKLPNPFYTITYSYDRLNRQTGKTEKYLDENNKLVVKCESAEFDANYKIASTDANGIRTGFEPDKLGRKKQTTFVDGTVHTVEFDAHRKYSESFANGDAKTETKFDYTKGARSLTIMHTDGSTEEDVFTVHGELSSHTNGEGEKVLHGYNTSGQRTGTTKAGRTKSKKFDEAGFLFYAKSYSGGETEFAGDKLGRTTKEENLTAGTTIITERPDRKTIKTTAAGETNVQHLGANEKVVESYVIKNGQKRLRHEFRHDNFGHVSKIIIGEGEETRVIDVFHTPSGKLKVKTLDPDGLAYKSIELYDLNDNVLCSIDADGLITRRVYDIHNRERFILKSNGALIEKRYNHLGLLTAEIEYANAVEIDHNNLVLTEADITPVASAEDKRTENFYDAAGKLIVQVKNNQITEYSYDAAGRVICQRQLFNAFADGQSFSALDAVLDAVKNLRDDDKDLIERKIYHDGRLSFTVSPYGVISQHELLANGRIEQVHRFDVRVANMLDAQNFTYEVLLAHSLQATTRRTTTTVKDGKGRDILTIDEKGYAKTFEYDSKDRVIKVHTYGEPYTGPRDESLLADDFSIATSDSDLIYGTTYFADNKIEVVTRTLRGNEVSKETYILDSTGDRRKRIDRAGNVWDYIFDKAGQEHEIESPAIEVADVTVTDDGKLQETTKKRRIKTKKEYSPAGRLKRTTQDVEGPVPRVLNTDYSTLGKLASTRQVVMTQDPTLDDRNPPQDVRNENETTAITEEVQDIFGRAVVKINAKGEREYTVYNRQDKPIYIISTKGVVTQQDFDSYGRCYRKIVYANPVVIAHDAYPKGISDQVIKTLITPSQTEDRTEKYSYAKNSELQPVETTEKDEVDYYRAKENTPGLQAIKRGRPTAKRIINTFDEVVATAELIDAETDTWATTLHFPNYLGQPNVTASLSPKGMLTVVKRNQQGKEIERSEFAESQTKEAVETGKIATNKKDRHYKTFIDGAGRIYRKLYPKTEITKLIREAGKFRKETEERIPEENFTHDAHDKTKTTVHKDGSVSLTERNALAHTVHEVAKPATTAADNDKRFQLETHSIPDAFGNTAISTESGRGVILTLENGEAKVAENQDAAEAIADRKILAKHSKLDKPTHIQDAEGALQQLSYDAIGDMRRHWYWVEQAEYDEKTDTVNIVQVLRDKRVIQDGLVKKELNHESHTDDSHATYQFAGQYTKDNAFGETVESGSVSCGQLHARQRFAYDQAARQSHATDKKGVEHLKAHDLQGHQTLAVSSMSEDVAALSLKDVTDRDSLIIKQSVLDMDGEIAQVLHPKYRETQLGLHLALALHHNDVGDNTLSWPVGNNHAVTYRIKAKPKNSDAPYQSYEVKRKGNRFYVELGQHYEELDFEITEHGLITIPVAVDPDKTGTEVKFEAPDFGFSDTPSRTMRGSFNYQDKASAKNQLSEAARLKSGQFAMASYHFTAGWRYGKQVRLRGLGGGKWYYGEQDRPFRYNRDYNPKNTVFVTSKDGSLASVSGTISFELGYNLGNLHGNYSSRHSQLNVTAAQLNQDTAEVVIEHDSDGYHYDGMRQVNVPNTRYGENSFAWYASYQQTMMQGDDGPGTPHSTPLAGVKTIRATINLSGSSVVVFDNKPDEVSHPTIIGPFDDNLMSEENPLEAGAVEIFIRDPQFPQDEFITLTDFHNNQKNDPDSKVEGDLNVQVAGKYLVLKGDSLKAGTYEIRLRAKTAGGRYAKPGTPSDSYRIEKDGFITGFLCVQENKDDLIIMPKATTEPAMVHSIESVTHDRWRNVVAQMTPANYQAWLDAGAKPDERSKYTLNNEFNASNIQTASTTPEVEVVDLEKSKAAKNLVKVKTRLKTKSFHDADGEEVAHTKPSGAVAIKRKAGDALLVSQNALGIIEHEAGVNIHAEVVTHADGAGNTTKFDRNRRGDVSDTVLPPVTQPENREKAQYTKHQKTNVEGDVIQAVSAEGVVTHAAFGPNHNNVLQAKPVSAETATTTGKKYEVTEQSFRPGTDIKTKIKTNLGEVSLQSDVHGNQTGTKDDKGNTTSTELNRLKLPVTERGCNETKNPTRDGFTHHFDKDPDDFGEAMPKKHIEHRYHLDGKPAMHHDVIKQQLERLFYDRNGGVERSLLTGEHGELYRNQTIERNAIDDYEEAINDHNLRLQYHLDKNRNVVCIEALYFDRKNPTLGDNGQHLPYHTEVIWNAFDAADRVTIDGGGMDAAGDIGLKDKSDEMIEGAREISYGKKRGMRVGDKVVYQGKLHDRQVSHDEWMRFVGLSDTAEGLALLTRLLNGDGQEDKVLDWRGDDKPHTVATDLITIIRRQAKSKAVAEDEKPTLVSVLNQAAARASLPKAKLETTTVRDERSGQVLSRHEIVRDVSDKGKETEADKVLKYTFFAPRFGATHTREDGEFKEDNNEPTKFWSETDNQFSVRDAEPQARQAKRDASYKPMAHHYSPEASTNYRSQRLDGSGQISANVDELSTTISSEFTHDFDSRVILKCDYEQTDKDKPAIPRYIYYYYARDRLVGMVYYGADGRVLKDEKTKRIRAYFNLSQMGINRAQVGQSQQYMVQVGDTFELIALKAYGDPEMAPIIAFDNGMAVYEQLTQGSVIQLRERPLMKHYNVNTHYVINKAELYGDFSPVMPYLLVPRVKKPHGLKKYLPLIVATVAVIATGGAAGVLAGMIAQGMLAGIIQGAIIGAVANAAAQATAIETGTQVGFDSTSLGKSALAGGFTGGLVSGLEQVEGLKALAESGKMSRTMYRAALAANTVAAGAASANLIYHQSRGELDHAVLASAAGALVGFSTNRMLGTDADGVSQGVAEQLEQIAASLEVIASGITSGSLDHNLDPAMVALQAVGAFVKTRVAQSANHQKKTEEDDTFVHGEGSDLSGDSGDDVLTGDGVDYATSQSQDKLFEDLGLFKHKAKAAAPLLCYDESHRVPTIEELLASRRRSIPEAAMYPGIPPAEPGLEGVYIELFFLPAEKVLRPVAYVAENVFQYAAKGLVRSKLFAGFMERGGADDVAGKRVVSGFKSWFFRDGGAEKSVRDIIIDESRARTKILREKFGGFTKHGINRVIQRNLTPKELQQTLKHALEVDPVKYDELGRASQKIIGGHSTIIIDPKTRTIITVYPTSSRIANQLLEKIAAEVEHSSLKIR